MGADKIEPAAVVPQGGAPLPATSNGPKKFPVKARDIYMLGITIVIGGQYFCWNAGFEAAGLYTNLIAFFVISSAYITFVMCQAEICGSLPFGGGSYGLSRCTLGFFPGFLIGSCDALEYIAYVSSSVVSLAAMIGRAAPSFAGNQTLIWLFFYGSALYVHIKGNYTFWYFNAFCAIISTLILILYVLGSIPFADFSTNAAVPELIYVDGFHGFMRVLPLATWFYVGVESLILTADVVENPKEILPKAQVACVLTLFFTGLATWLITVSLPPGLWALSANLVPFNNGLMPMLNISDAVATIFSIPATYATAFGFIWSYGKLIAAMATSKLLPEILGEKSRHGTPYAGLLFGSGVGYFVCLVVYFIPEVGLYLFNVCIICGFMSYTGQCIGYIALRRSFKNIKKSTFHNPFGIFGAIWSMCVWIMCMISIIGFQGNGGVEAIAFAIMVSLLTLYYFLYAKKRQTFSAEENKILLVAHVMKFNVRRQKPGSNKNASGIKKNAVSGSGTASQTNKTKSAGHSSHQN